MQATQEIKLSDANEKSEFFARVNQIFSPFFMTDLLNIPRHIFDSFLLSRQQSHYLQQHMFQESPATKWSLFHTVKGVPEEEYFISHNKLP